MEDSKQALEKEEQLLTNDISIIKNNSLIEVFADGKKIYIPDDILEEAVQLITEQMEYYLADVKCKIVNL